MVENIVKETKKMLAKVIFFTVNFLVRIGLDELEKRIKSYTGVSSVDKYWKQHVELKLDLLKDDRIKPFDYPKIKRDILQLDTILTALEKGSLKTKGFFSLCS